MGWRQSVHCINSNHRLSWVGLSRGTVSSTPFSGQSSHLGLSVPTHSNVHLYWLVIFFFFTDSVNFHLDRLGSLDNLARAFKQIIPLQLRFLLRGGVTEYRLRDRAWGDTGYWLSFPSRVVWLRGAEPWQCAEPELHAWGHRRRVKGRDYHGASLWTWHNIITAFQNHCEERVH